MKLLDGKEIAKEIRTELSKAIADFKQTGITPKLTVILVGSNQASKTYVNSKKKVCIELGMESEVIEYPETVSEVELLGQISKLNQDDSVHGILVQLPLPKHIDDLHVTMAILPEKDVDGFHPINVGKLAIKQNGFVPCTPLGVMKLLEKTGTTIAGKHAVVIGRSNIVGKPMGQLLLNAGATVTYCHSQTVNLTQYTIQADILVIAIGMPKFIQATQIKEGAIVIDVGMNRDEDQMLCGDADFERVKEKSSFITPVPGGVGPMTITMLMYNTLKAAKEFYQKKEMINI